MHPQFRTHSWPLETSLKLRHLPSHLRQSSVQQCVLGTTSLLRRWIWAQVIGSESSSGSEPRISHLSGHLHHHDSCPWFVDGNRVATSVEKHADFRSIEAAISIHTCTICTPNLHVRSQELYMGWVEQRWLDYSFTLYTEQRTQRIYLQDRGTYLKSETSATWKEAVLCLKFP